MKERLITFVCALGALALFAVMFLKREGPFGRSDVPAPITSERRGLLGGALPVLRVPHVGSVRDLLWAQVVSHVEYAEFSCT